MSCDCLNGATGEPCPEEAIANCYSCRKRICTLHTDKDDQEHEYCPDCALQAGVATCREKVGFLTIKDCKKRSTAKCTACQCPLCQDHAVATPKGVLCSRCASEQGIQDSSDKGYRRHSYNRYYYHGYEPHYWGSDWRYRSRYRTNDSYYDDNDAHIFDEHKSDSAALGALEGEDSDFGAS